MPGVEPCTTENILKSNEVPLGYHENVSLSHHPSKGGWYLVAVGAVRVCMLQCSDQSAWLLRFRVWLSSLPVRDCVPWDPDMLAFGMKNVTDCDDFLKSRFLCLSSNRLLLGPGVQRVVNSTSSGLLSLSWTVEQKLVCPGVRAIFMVWSYFYSRLILPIGLTPTLWKRGEEKEGRASPSVLAVLGPKQQHPDRSLLLLTHFLSGRLLLNMKFHFILWQEGELDEIWNFSSDASSTVLLWAVFKPTLMYTFFCQGYLFKNPVAWSHLWGYFYAICLSWTHVGFSSF